MNVSEAIKSRFSVRAYLDKKVDREVIYKLLDVARFSPSGHNIQPWEVMVLTGKSKDNLSNKLIEDVKSKRERVYDYEYAIKNMPAYINKRRKACNAKIFTHKHIDPKKDKEALNEHILENFRFFNAPVELLILMDKNLGDGAYIDIGMFAQSIMLAALDFGLATCAQASISAYADTIHRELDIPQNKIVLFGLSLGYPDTENYINKLRMDREEVENFTKFLD